MAAVSVFFISQTIMSVWVDISITHSQGNAHFFLRRQDRTLQQIILDSKQPSMKCLPAKCEHAHTDCKAAVAFFNSSKPFSQTHTSRLSAGKCSNVDRLLLKVRDSSNGPHASITAEEMTWQLLQ